MTQAGERAQLPAIERDVALAPYTSLELGGPARFFTRAGSDVELIAALRWAAERALPVALLGGGSNLVVPDAGFPGLVIALRQRGVRHEVRGSVVLVRAAAGEPWDELCAFAVERDLAGLECLSGIPGLCGATPIQNVGAYGQEVGQCLEHVRALDRTSLAVHVLGNADCGFTYRHSALKREPERWVVLEVCFALRLGGEPLIAYDELRRALADSTAPSLPDVRRTVLALRRAKSMLIEPGDDNRRSAGSFFLNPIVSAADADRVAAQTRATDMPRFEQPDGRVKLAAAWLIERAGFRKGERHGTVGISSRHALSLVHHGGGSTRELLALAGEIQARVHERFGVDLVREPVLLGE